MGQDIGWTRIVRFEGRMWDLIVQYQFLIIAYLFTSYYSAMPNRLEKLYRVSKYPVI